MLKGLKRSSSQGQLDRLKEILLFYNLRTDGEGVKARSLRAAVGEDVEQFVTTAKAGSGVAGLQEVGFEISDRKKDSLSALLLP